MIKISDLKKKNKGQSFLEMTLVLGVLLLLVVGMAEFGNLLNLYINLVDAAREGARFGSNNDPFFYSNVSGATWYDYSAPNPEFFKNIDTIVEGDTNVDPKQRTSALSPIVLAPTYGTRSNGDTFLPDDVLIRFYAVSGKSITGSYPVGGPWSKYGSGQVSKITTAEILEQLDSGAPNTGILVVEIFYNYHQMLNFPFFTAIVPNPVPVHVYSFMPLAGAEATPTP